MNAKINKTQIDSRNLNPNSGITLIFRNLSTIETTYIAAKELLDAGLAYMLTDQDVVLTKRFEIQ